MLACGSAGAAGVGCAVGVGAGAGLSVLGVLSCGSFSGAGGLDVDTDTEQPTRNKTPIPTSRGNMVNSFALLFAEATHFSDLNNAIDPRCEHFGKFL